MTVSLKFYALKRRRKINGEIPIYLRITKNKKYRYLSTGISVEEKHWNAKDGVVRKSHRRYRILNQKLRDFLDNAEDASSQLKRDRQTLATVKETLKQKDQLNFFNYASDFVQTMKTEGNLWEARQTDVLMGQLRDFFKTKDIEFGDITLKKLEEFRRYMAEVLENNPNTINKKIKRLRRIFRQASIEEVVTSNPFEHYRPLKSNEVIKTRLSADQIQRISSLDLEAGSLIWHVRNAFMFSYYNAGIRFSDLCQLKWLNIVDQRLLYKMSKTGGIKNIRLGKHALRILEYYETGDSEEEDFIFPFLKNHVDYSDKLFLKSQISSKNAIANKVLKKIARMANIESNVSFHVSRHSFADHARRSEMNIYDISKALGHSDIETTQQYLASFDEQSLDKGMSRLFGDDENDE